MRVSRIYVDQPINLDSRLELPADKAHYIKHVLRLKQGSPLIVFNGRDLNDYQARLEVAGRQLSAMVSSATPKSNEAPLSVSILQAAGRTEHMDFITQKATELGAFELHYFNSERTQSPLKGPRLEKKLAHWRSIAESACEQSDRNMVPGIHFHPTLQACLDQVPIAQRLILDFNGQSLTRQQPSLSSSGPFQLLVGAEGGLNEMEITLARSAGFTPVRLGPRTLRMETATTAMLTLVQHYFGDL